MGPVNWTGVVVAAVLATVAGQLWYAWLGGSRRPAPAALALMIVPATLIGHNFARVGAATLAMKPWLYFMMSGGFALAMVLPALVVVHSRHALPRRGLLVDGGYFLLAYLLVGAVFRLSA